MNMDDLSWLDVVALFLGGAIAAVIVTVIVLMIVGVI